MGELAPPSLHVHLLPHVSVEPETVGLTVNSQSELKRIEELETELAAQMRTKMQVGCEPDCVQ